MVDHEWVSQGDMAEDVAGRGSAGVILAGSVYVSHLQYLYRWQPGQGDMAEDVAGRDSAGVVLAGSVYVSHLQHLYQSNAYHQMLKIIWEL